ncbi:hypothetical protein Tco_0851216 [Tanacetum coccineum]
MTFEQRSSSLVLHQMTSDHNRSELGIHDHSNEPSSSKLVPKVVPLAVKTATSRQELELLFHHHIAMLRTTEASTQLKAETVNNMLSGIKVVVDIGKRHLGTQVNQWHNHFPAIRGFFGVSLLTELVSFVKEIHSLSIDISSEFVRY